MAKEVPKIIRVFARKTSMTPTDDLAFFDGPPLYELPDVPVYVSVTFTWDIEKGKYLQKLWDSKYKTYLGGPALGIDMDRDFRSGRFLKEGITITSRGCPKKCPWCLVPKREGKLREINIAPGHIIQDNNLLACSREHIEKVFDILGRQKRAVQFKGGLDIDYLKPWHIDLMKKVKIGELWVACDCEKDLKRMDKAADLLGDFSIEKKRCYVLMGFGDDTPEAAELRCEKIYEKGFLPFAQFYQPNGKRRTVNKEWHYIVRKWSRPAAYRPRKGK